MAEAAHYGDQHRHRSTLSLAFLCRDIPVRPSLCRPCTCHQTGAAAVVPCQGCSPRQDREGEPSPRGSDKALRDPDRCHQGAAPSTVSGDFRPSAPGQPRSCQSRGQRDVSSGMLGVCRVDGLRESSSGRAARRQHCRDVRKRVGGRAFGGGGKGGTRPTPSACEATFERMAGS